MSCQADPLEDLSNNRIPKCLRCIKLRQHCSVQQNLEAVRMFVVYGEGSEQLELVLDTFTVPFTEWGETFALREEEMARLEKVQRERDTARRVADRERLRGLGPNLARSVLDDFAPGRRALGAYAPWTLLLPIEHTPSSIVDQHTVDNCRISTVEDIDSSRIIASMKVARHVVSSLAAYSGFTQARQPGPWKSMNFTTRCRQMIAGDDKWGYFLRVGGTYRTSTEASSCRAFRGRRVNCLRDSYCDVLRTRRGLIHKAKNHHKTCMSNGRPRGFGEQRSLRTLSRMEARALDYANAHKLGGICAAVGDKDKTGHQVLLETLIHGSEGRLSYQV
ncbi:hypothetical protein MRB53_039203 [Persea americana]|nr:hypothetical protein MRB53_039203 [Persea americana]